MTKEQRKKDRKCGTWSGLVLPGQQFLQSTAECKTDNLTLGRWRNQIAMTVDDDTLALQTAELYIEFGIIYIIITTPKITT